MVKRLRTYPLFTILLSSMLFLYSCSIKRYIPNGEYLFSGGEVIVVDTVKIDNLSDIKSELQTVLYPKPNRKILGIYPGLYYHFKAKKEKPGFIVRYMNKRIGEEPVYLSDVGIDGTKDLIENRLENNGFFRSDITSKIYKDTSSKTAKSDYTVTIGKPYTLNKYFLEVDSGIEYPIYAELEKCINETKLVKDTRYDLNSFELERNRIDQELKEKGYYNFNATFILFQVDTNLGLNNKYNLYLKIKDGVPSKSKVPYLINTIKVYPNVSGDTLQNYDTTTVINDISYNQSQTFFKPKRLAPFILLEPNQLYSPKDSKYTSRRISSIGTYKFVNINYEQVDSINSDTLKYRYLNSVISLSPLTKRSLKTELQVVTKSNNFTGPNLGLTYLNRNVFKGGENFSTTATIGYEKQFGNNTSGSTSLEIGLSASLSFPRLIFPGNFNNFFRYSVPKTNVSMGIEYFRRSNLFSLTSYSASLGYSLNANRFVSHQLTPIVINYLQLGNRSDLFNSILDENPFLKRSFEQQFIAGLSYSFYYNEMGETRKKGRLNFNFNFEMAGNTLGLIAMNQTNDSVRNILGIPYAQYVKADIDLSYNYSLGKSGEAIVARIFGGIGVPYGNSQTLPFVKQYFSGGSYSVRAFQIRGLGPGVYDPVNKDNLFFDRSGDIKLEGNLEYRFPLISYLKGAIFADAGNIWNLNNNLPGGQFSSDFINQLGVGSGFGIRLDVQGFVLRLDLAAPIKRPETSWLFDYKNPVLNFAIGYPF